MADYMFGCRRTTNSPEPWAQKRNMEYSGKRRYVIVLSELLIFSNELVIQAIIKNTTTFYTKLCAYTYTHTHSSGTACFH